MSGRKSPRCTKDEADIPSFSKMVTSGIHIGRSVLSFLITIQYIYILWYIFKYTVSPVMTSGEGYLKESVTASISILGKSA